MSVARRLAVAFAVVGLGVLAYAVPASATESRTSDGCITNPTPDQLIGTLDPRHGTADVWARPGVDLCADVLLSAYTVPDTWDGAEFDRSAIPQQLYGKTSVGQVSGRARTALTVAVPTCGAVQIDLYTPPEITAVTDLSGHNGHLIQGYIWRWYADGKPVDCNGSSTSPTPTPTASTTSPVPVPSESSTSPVPSPSESSTSPVPSPSESSTSPVPSPSESSTAPAPSTTGPTPAPTTPLAGLIPPGATPGPIVIVVPVPPTTPTTPVLASTGSNATLPLIGFGGALLVAGIALSVLGRRRRTA